MALSQTVVAEDEVESFLASLRAGDVDKKVNLIQLWGLKLETVSILPERTIDAVTLLVAPFLRSPAHLLVTSSLSFLPVFIPLIPTTSSPPHLRLALHQFLPSLLERVNDPKDKVHEPAGDSIALLGRKCYATESQPPSGPSSSKGKDKDSVAGVWEHAVKETLAGRGARAKIVILKMLLTMRADKSTKLPLKPWLPALVSLLEDSDGGVRDQARETVVALLSPPSTPPAARSELKKLMLQRNVRKSIADGIIQRVLGGTTTSKTSTPDASQAEGTQSRESAPQSNAATPEDIPKVYIANAKDLENEFKAMVPHFEGKETEHNWGPRENAVVRIRGMLRGGVFEQQPDSFVQGLKHGVLDGIIKTLMSLRTTVAQHACSLVQELAEDLGPSFDPSVEQLLPTLAKMSGFTKRIIAEKSQRGVTAIITYSTTPPRILISHITAALQEKSVQSRQYGTSHLKTFLDTQASKHTSAVESTPGAVDQLEQSLKRCLADTNPQVRETARAAFWSFHNAWPRQGAAMLDSLDGTARKQLEKANPAVGDAAAAAVVKTTPSKPRASSAMSAILAAKRAKAAELAAERKHSAPSPANVPLPETPAPGLRVQPTFEPDVVPAVWTPAGPTQEETVAPSEVDVGSQRPHTPVSTSGPTNGRPRSQIPTPKSAKNSPSGPKMSHIPVSSSPKSPKAYPTSLGNKDGSPSLADRKAPSLTALPKVSPLNDRKASERKTHVSRTSSSALPRPPNARSAESSSASTRSTSPSLARSMSRSPPSLLESMQSLRQAGVRASAPSSEASAAVRTPLQNSAYLPRTPRGNEPRIVSPSLHSLTTPDAHRLSPQDGRRGSGPYMTPPSRNAFFDQSPIDPEDEARRAQVAQGLSAAQQLLDFDDDQQPLSVDPITPVRAPPRSGPGLLQRPQFNGSGGRRPSWEDSPRAMTPRLLEKLHSRAYERSWWNQRLNLIEQASPLKSETGNAAPCVQEDVTGLLSNTPTLKNLQKLTLFSTNNALPLDMEDADRNEIVQRRAMWEEGALFDRMFDGLMVFLDPKQPAGLLEQAVVLLWEMVQNQWCLCETREDALLDAVFKLRSSTNPVILESTNSLVSLLTEVCDPPFLLSLLHSALDRFLAAHISEVNKVGENEVHGERAIAAGYNFGLNAMGMCIIHLPKEVVELEAKRLEKQVMAALALTSTDGVAARQAAHRLILAVQCMLSNDVHTLALFPRLNAGQRSFVTYLMQQNGVMGKPPVDSEEDATRRRSVLDELVGGLAKGARVRK